MTTAQRINAAGWLVILEGVVAITQIIAAIATSHIMNWFVAILAIALGAIGWVIMSPDECEQCNE
jgi:hypothetical protein